ncbi:MAG: hypothetical protein Kow0029_01300 [Candidatus Rifleibacteriota bacterium]
MKFATYIGNQLYKGVHGVTLVEIMMAVVILAVAALPVIGTFSRYYGVASMQLEKEIGLKIAEASMNKLMTHKYSDLVSGGPFSVPLDFKTPSGTFSGELKFDKFKGKTGSIKIGKVDYTVSAEINKVFVRQDIYSPHDQALELKYAADPADMPPPAVPPPPGPPPPLFVVATYSSFDDLVSIKLEVDMGGQREKIRLAAFRADMSQ